MLATDFFKIKQMDKGENTVSFTVLINPQHQVFEGHFPQQPVVPGVFTLQMIKECMEIFLEKKWRYSELINCKFSRPILPKNSEEILIDCEYTLVDSLQLKAIVRVGDFNCLTLKAILVD
jgi:3-hydroxyacyl-[acyl-carrier-protein] dehydratase